MPSIEIYTDGGCDPNPGPGGWAAILIFSNGEIKERYGGEKDTTNNRMELMAAIEALKILTDPHEITLHTDSQYLKQGITEWIEGWVANNWQRRKDPIKNVDLWQELHRLCRPHQIQWQWVKGHAGNKYNEWADKLASAAIPRVEQKLNPDAVQIYLRLSDEDVLRACARGWAACIVRDGDEEILTGGHPADSPNRFPLFAALEILNQLQESRPIQFFTPSKFLYDGMTGWLNRWREGNWVKPDKFRGEWKALDKANRERQIEWVFMRNPLPAQYDLLESHVAKARTKAPHLPMPAEIKDSTDNSGTKPMF